MNAILNARKAIMPVQPVSKKTEQLRSMPEQLFQRSPLLSGDDVAAKREEIRAYFHTTLDRYEQLFETLHGMKHILKNRFLYDIRSSFI